MHPAKFEHPANFRYAKPSDLVTHFSHLGEDVYRFEADAKRWKSAPSLVRLDEGFDRKIHHHGGSLDEGGLAFSIDGERVLDSLPGMAFGLSGAKWILNFGYRPRMRYYGLGERATGLEKTGQRAKVWQTDVWQDNPSAVCREGRPDPMYAGLPYVLVRGGSGWIGILVDCPYPVFTATGAPSGGLAERYPPPEERQFYLGAVGGRPRVYFILGRSASDVTRRLQRLIGPAPLPPLWALGYHQSRWGYMSFADLDELDRRFTEEAIPADAFWLDIDYMEGYRAFTFNERGFSHPRDQLEDLRRRGRRVVAILNPGLKVDAGFPAFAEAAKADLLCKNPEGRPFVGVVWPGETVFPDFSLPETREWWAGKVAAFVDHGVSGLWLDMNEPATGWVEQEDMLFGRGRAGHESCHNEYALGMQVATRAGMERARPSRRPFLLSRSGYLTSSRYAALWTGDNYSNPRHLRDSIAMSINLSLSGLPFNGPDVPGFGGDASPELAVAWYKAAFLFPFLRNHCHRDATRQEPWAFPEKVKATIASFIRLRYKLLPYLYGLFADQEESGDPILRPLFYDFDGDETLELVDDEFMVGPAVLQAPVLDPAAAARDLVLPGSDVSWYAAHSGRWLSGGLVVRERQIEATTPIFFRADVILPMRVEGDDPLNKDMSEVELHVLLPPGSKRLARGRYRFDDGESLTYRKGLRSGFGVSAVRNGRILDVEVIDTKMNFKPCGVRIVVYAAVDLVRVRMGTEEHRFKPVVQKRTFMGRRVVVRTSGRFVVRNV